MQTHAFQGAAVNGLPPESTFWTFSSLVDGLTPTRPVLVLKNTPWSRRQKQVMIAS